MHRRITAYGGAFLTLSLFSEQELKQVFVLCDVAHLADEHDVGDTGGGDEILDGTVKVAQVEHENVLVVRRQEGCKGVCKGVLNDEQRLTVLRTALYDVCGRVFQRFHAEVRGDSGVGVHDVAETEAALTCRPVPRAAETGDVEKVMYRL